MDGDVSEFVFVLMENDTAESHILQSLHLHLYSILVKYVPINSLIRVLKKANKTQLFMEFSLHS